VRKKYVFLIILAFSVMFLMCKQSEKAKKSENWEGVDECQEFLKLDLLPKELLYPGSMCVSATVLYRDKGNEIHVDLITKDNYKKVTEYYIELLPQKGWALYKPGFLVDEGGSVFDFTKDKREVLFHTNPTDDGKYIIEILWRPDTG